MLRRAYTENTPSIFADASKVVPSRFQKREGSIYATPGSRDAHTGQGKVRDQTFHDKLKQKVCASFIRHMTTQRTPRLITRRVSGLDVDRCGLIGKSEGSVPHTIAGLVSSRNITRVGVFEKA